MNYLAQISRVCLALSVAAIAVSAETENLAAAPETAGVSVQRIRSSIQALRKLLPQIERPLSELVLVATGDVVLVFHEGAAFEALSGQEWVFEVAKFKHEVDKWHDLKRARPVRRARAESVDRSA